MQITGQFIKIIYRGNNGYTVAVFELDNRLEEEITVTGYFPQPEKDKAYNLYGEYVEHPRYGMQFSVEQLEKVPFTDAANLIRYLSGSQFRGIGPKYAEVLVASLGTDLIERIK
ncbi:MAG: ATP-dependent RecD-like DNA helicase, partial [Erysipelotrichaceae bacterium]|nr:ATP-dependent RecD-like DNA helicase [Erysipelotrichaceae bacterium]